MKTVNITLIIQLKKMLRNKGVNIDKVDKTEKNIYTISINLLSKGIIFAKEGIKTRNGQEENIFYTKRFVFF